MKRTILLVLTTTLVSLPGTSARAWDFVYGYRTVFDTNADTYVLSTQNVRKYSEWTDPPVTYWGPSSNDVPGLLTSRFDFAAPAARIRVHAELVSYNYPWRGDYGFCSLWGSINGNQWHLLLDNPIPASAGPPAYSSLTFDQDLPPSLLGASSLWLQVRLQEHDALPVAGDPRATWADAQFSRVQPPPTGNVFQVSARLGPAASIRVSEAEICWASVSNTIYQVEYRSSLTTNIWVPLFTNLVGSGEEMSVFDKIPRGSPHRFYRVAYPTP